LFSELTNPLSDVRLPLFLGEWTLQVTVDVPDVGGKLILIDMAGSENIDQAGLGRELKMQVINPT
jgi:hypothetical protein